MNDLDCHWMTMWDVFRDLVSFVRFKNVKNTHGGVLLVVKLMAEAYNFSKSNTPPWLFFAFLELYKWYQTAQSLLFQRPNQ